MFACTVCCSDYSDGVRCSKCALMYCFSCANTTESNYRKLGSARQAALVCGSCKAQSKACNASPSVQPGKPEPCPATLDLVLQELRNGIAGINVRLEQLPPIVQELQNMKDSINKFDESLRDIKKEVNQNSGKILEVEKRVEMLENHSVDAGYPHIQNIIQKLSSELADKDRILRINNIEIKGVPFNKNENLFILVSKIGSLIGQPIQKSDINFVTRARSFSQSKPIIVGFLSRYLKENIVASARSHKLTLTAEELGFSANSGKIFINDHLTRDMKQLLTKTKKTAAEKNHNYVWVQNSKILTRKNDTSPIIAVTSDSDLLKIK